MTTITFDRAHAENWLREHLPHTDQPRACEYVDWYSVADSDIMFGSVDTEQLGVLVDDYRDAFGVRLIAWVDDDEMGGVRIDVELPVPGAEPLRLAGTWGEMRAWVDCDPIEGHDDEAAVRILADFLESVAQDATGTLTAAQRAVAAGVLATPRERPNPLDDAHRYCVLCRDPGHEYCPGEVDGCPCCAETNYAAPSGNYCVDCGVFALHATHHMVWKSKGATA